MQSNRNSFWLDGVLDSVTMYLGMKTKCLTKNMKKQRYSDFKFLKWLKKDLSITALYKKELIRFILRVTFILIFIFVYHLNKLKSHHIYNLNIVALLIWSKISISSLKGIFPLSMTTLSQSQRTFQWTRCGTFCDYKKTLASGKIAEQENLLFPALMGMFKRFFKSFKVDSAESADT